MGRFLKHFKGILVFFSLLVLTTGSVVYSFGRDDQVVNLLSPIINQGDFAFTQNLIPSLSVTISPKPIELAKPTSIEKKESNIKTSDLNMAVNDYRKSYSKQALLNDQKLCKVAEERLLELSKNYEHDNFSAVKRSGIAYKNVAENIAQGKLTPSVVINLWAKSEGHNKNMLGDFNKGCGTTNGKFAVYLFLKD